MAKRMILMLIVIATALSALGVVKFRQIQASSQSASFRPPPEAVTTIVARQENWPVTLTVIGTVAAVQGVNVSADLPGIVSRIGFDSGGSVREGDVLVQLDIRQEQAQLAAIEAERDLARLNFARLEGLVNEGAISRAEYDRAAAEQKQTEAKVEEIRATIERKTIRAPFSGILGIRQVNLGQYLSAGDAVVALQSLDPIYVNFGVPQQQAAQVRIGGAVRITVGDTSGAAFDGTQSQQETRQWTKPRETCKFRPRSRTRRGRCDPACLFRPKWLGRQPVGIRAAGVRLSAMRHMAIRCSSLRT